MSANDDLSTKLSGLFSKAKQKLGSKGGGTFKGTGHRLGGAEDPAAAAASTSRPHTAAAAPTAPPPQPRPAAAPIPAPQQPRAAQQQPAAVPANKSAAAAAAEARIAATAARGRGGSAARAPAAPLPQPQARLLPAAAGDFDPFQPALGGGAALNAIRTESQPQQPQPQQQHLPPPPPQQQQQHKQVKGRPVTDEERAKIAACASLVLSHPAAVDSRDVLTKLLGNLVASPHEAKYRQIRLGNRRVKEAVAGAPGGCEFLAACGFVVHAEADGGAGGGSTDDGGFAAFLEDELLPLAAEGLKALTAAAAAAGIGSSSNGNVPVPAAAAAAAPAAAPAASPAASPAAAPRPPPPRNARVLLPVATVVDLDAAFFERTPAELRADYARAAAARREAETLMTRAQREARAAAVAGGGGAARRAPLEAAVRVRFPEGLQLAGTFGVSEPLSAVHEFVASSLRDPTALFELVTPSRAPLPVTGAVGAAGLAPSVLLNFRAVGGGGGSGGSGLPALSDDMLARATID